MSSPSTTDSLAGWNGLFQQSSEAIFLLNSRRRIRFVNKAWERLAGHPSENVMGLFCLARKRKGVPALQALAQTMAPPSEVLQGRGDTVRRPIPPARVGPPWWDITFLPVSDDKGLLGIIGKIIRIGEGKASSQAGKGFTETLIQLRQRMTRRYSFDLLASAVTSMDRLASQARAASQTLSPVWIHGEGGAGKETLARIIHFQGKTREQTFLKIDCAGLQPFLIRNMLFGENGLAESSRLGSIYFKEPADLPRDVQSELLDWFVEQETPPRIMVGTSRLASELIHEEKMLPDFWSVLGVLELNLPPLRERMDDLPRLLGRIGERVKSPFPGVSSEVLELFRQHSWPGNLRELQQTLLESLDESGGKRIEIAHLPNSLREQVRRAKSLPPRPNSSSPSLHLAPILERTEKKLIRLALQKAHGNKTEAADLLGLTRTQLWRRLKDLGLESE